MCYSTKNISLLTHFRLVCLVPILVVVYLSIKFRSFLLVTCLDVVLGYTVTLISFSAKCFCFRKHFCIELCRRTSFCLLVEKTLEKSLSCTMFLNCDVGVLVILWPIYFFSIEYIFRLHKSANYNWFFYCATC